LKNEFDYILRLQVKSLKVLDLSVDRNFNVRKQSELKKLVVKQKPTYLEDDPAIITLMRNKFLEQQRFELRQKLSRETNELEDSFKMISLSDLVDGQLEIELDEDSFRKKVQNRDPSKQEIGKSVQLKTMQIP